MPFHRRQHTSDEYEGLSTAVQNFSLSLASNTYKIPGDTLNAYGAVLQMTREGSPTGSPDFVLFSSWIPAIVSGYTKDGGIEGSVAGHVKAVVSGYPS